MPVPPTPAVIVTLLLPFEHLFDPRTWRKAQLEWSWERSCLPGKARTVQLADVRPQQLLGIGQHGDFAIYRFHRAQPCPMVAAATEPGRHQLLLVAGRLGSSTESSWCSAFRRDGGTTLGPEGLRPRGGIGIRCGSRTTRCRGHDPSDCNPVSLMVADAYRMGGFRHWALHVFDTALVVSARYDRLPTGRRHIQYVQNRLFRPADAGLPAPVAFPDSGPGGGDYRWRLRQARVPAAIARTCQSRLSSLTKLRKDASPVPARATAAARPDRAAQERVVGAQLPSPTAVLDDTATHRWDSLPRHRFATAVPPWSSSLRA